MVPILFIFILLNTIYIKSANCNIFSYFSGDSPLKSFVFWPNATVPFHIVKEHFDKDQVEAILNSLHLFTFKTCLKFVPTPDMPGDEHHVMVFHNPTGVKRCTHSTTGHSIEEPHFVTLGYDCLKSPNIDMMVMRALGFPFEHNRASRDVFVTIQQENVESNFMELFSKDQSLPQELRALPYDVDSVMHFDIRDYSKNGHRTIIFKDRKLIQNRQGLTDNDLKKIEIVYGSECLTRDRQAKIDLCQFFPGVARKKREIGNIVEESVTVKTAVTKSTKELNVLSEKVILTLKDLDIVDEVQHIVDSIHKVSSMALQNARNKFCNTSNDIKPKIVRKSGKYEDILGVIELVTSHAKSMVDHATTNLTNFCKSSVVSDDYQRQCAFYIGKKCAKTFYKSTKTGAVQYRTQHKPVPVLSTGRPSFYKNIYRSNNEVDGKENVTVVDNKFDVRKKRSNGNIANETVPSNNATSPNQSEVKNEETATINPVSTQPAFANKDDEYLKTERKKRGVESDKPDNNVTSPNQSEASVVTQNNEETTTINPVSSQPASTNKDDELKTERKKREAESGKPDNNATSPNQSEATVVTQNNEETATINPVSSQPASTDKDDELKTERRKKRETDSDNPDNKTLVVLETSKIPQNTIQEKIPKLVVESISDSSAGDSTNVIFTDNPLVLKDFDPSSIQKTTFVASVKILTDSQSKVTTITNESTVKDRKKRAAENEADQSQNAGIKLDLKVNLDGEKSADPKPKETVLEKPTDQIASENVAVKLEVNKEEEIKKQVEQEIKTIKGETSSITPFEDSVSETVTTKKTPHEPSLTLEILKLNSTQKSEGEFNLRRNQNDDMDIYVTTESRPDVVSKNIKKRSVEAQANDTAPSKPSPKIQPVTEKLDDELATLNVHYQSQSRAPESITSKEVEPVKNANAEEAKSSRKKREVFNKNRIEEHPILETPVRHKRGAEDNAWIQHVGQLRRLLDNRRRNDKRKTGPEAKSDVKIQHFTMRRRNGRSKEVKPSEHEATQNPAEKTDAKIERAMEIGMVQENKMKYRARRTEETEEDSDTSDISAKNKEFQDTELSDSTDQGDLLENKPISLDISLEIMKPGSKNKKHEKRRSSHRKKSKLRQKEAEKPAESKESSEKPHKSSKKKEHVEEEVKPETQVVVEEESSSEESEESEDKPAQKLKKIHSIKKKDKSEDEEEEKSEKETGDREKSDKEKSEKETSREVKSKQEESEEAKLEVIDVQEPEEKVIKKQKRKHVSIPPTVTLSKKNKEFYHERKWLDNVAPYYITITEGYDIHDLRQRLAAVNKILLKKTCVSIEEISEKEAQETYEDYLVLDTSADYVTGRTGGKQIFGSVELFEGGQHRQHTAMMVMAMLGFYFEVARHDRDQHVRVHLRHVRPDKLHHFEKMRDDATLPVPYDYESATQPAWQFWRKLGMKGISTVATFKEMDPDGSKMRRLGQHEKLLSDTDVLKINSVYGVKCFTDARRSAPKPTDVRYVLEIF